MWCRWTSLKGGHKVSWPVTAQSSQHRRHRRWRGGHGWWWTSQWWWWWWWWWVSSGTSTNQEATQRERGGWSPRSGLTWWAVGLGLTALGTGFYRSSCDPWSRDPLHIAKVKVEPSTKPGILTYNNGRAKHTKDWNWWGGAQRRTTSSWHCAQHSWTWSTRCSIWFTTTSRSTSTWTP